MLTASARSAVMTSSARAAARRRASVESLSGRALEESRIADCAPSMRRAIRAIASTSSIKEYARRRAVEVNELACRRVIWSSLHGCGAADNRDGDGAAGLAAADDDRPGGFGHGVAVEGERGVSIEAGGFQDGIKRGIAQRDPGRSVSRDDGREGIGVGGGVEDDGLRGGGGAGGGLGGGDVGDDSAGGVLGAVAVQGHGVARRRYRGHDRQYRYHQ